MGSKDIGIRKSEFEEKFCNLQRVVSFYIKVYNNCVNSSATVIQLLSRDCMEVKGIESLSQNIKELHHTGCKDIGIRKFEFVAKSQVLSINPPCKEENIQFTTEPFKSLTNQREKRTPCVYL